MSIQESAIQSLRAAIRGTILLPGESGYDDARHLWNGMIDRNPALIAQCTGPDDVSHAIAFAREHELPLTVKGGGHGVAGKAVCDGGLMIDCSPMDAVEIDPVAQIARAGGGVTWGAFDTATQRLGLASTGGVVASTGIAGLTLGGGIGFLIRQHGMSCDNLIGAEIVAADGSLLVVSKDEHPDLLWGLRGGGGNFGVVTTLIFQLHPVSKVVGGVITHPFENAADLLLHYREVTTSASDEFKVDLGLGHTASGDPTVNFVAFHGGNPESAGIAIDGLRRCGQPLSDTVASTTYLNMQLLFAETFPHGTLNYWKSSFLQELSDGAIDVMIERFRVAPSTHLAINLEHLGGAMWRVDSSATAFPERSAAYNLIINGCWTDPAETESNIYWIRGTWKALQPFAKESVYANYLDAGDESRAITTYGSNYNRLAELKARYDPENLFRHNQNIAPR